MQATFHSRGRNQISWKIFSTIDSQSVREEGREGLQTTEKQIELFDLDFIQCFPSLSVSTDYSHHADRLPICPNHLPQSLPRNPPDCSIAARICGRTSITLTQVSVLCSSARSCSEYSHSHSQLI